MSLPSRSIRLDGTSAFNRCGRGMGASWPNGTSPVPPIRLDHIFLSRDLTCRDLARGKGAGSDHRPLVVTIGFAAGGEPR